jgi:hypothetical protein
LEPLESCAFFLRVVWSTVNLMASAAALWNKWVDGWNKNKSVGEGSASGSGKACDVVGYAPHNGRGIMAYNGIM